MLQEEEANLAAVEARAARLQEAADQAATSAATGKAAQRTAAAAAEAQARASGHQAGATTRTTGPRRRCLRLQTTCISCS